MDPFKQLTSILDMRISEGAGNAISGIPSELGTITATGLVLDSFKHEVQDYLVAEWFVKAHFPSVEISGQVTGLLDGQGKAVTGKAKFAFESFEVEDLRLELKAGLKPGDRVLAVPINGGNDAIVIGKVVKS
ncbi:hypothetical protein E0485_23030 [Paenibacillus albiflavus]|uniref:DUF2577 domain-containing protein n=1 Tax=Paenibacillus albiflavus TaxID=2545760 RepID=A0A4R4E2L6_9BACL|nr:hypothetical protein [Paenibacillus albiflavus]TCZ70964.1 hypothetical protein E0485_23030 [Paenibacillus albiflavus]